MKRSTVNKAIKNATNYFEANGWTLPPNPRWDVTDFGLGDFSASGLVLVNLCEEVEYCEKLMYARKSQMTPNHYHKKKKEDIICRTGVLAVQVWKTFPVVNADEEFEIQINNQKKKIRTGTIVTMKSGERITLTQGICHQFWPESEECIIGEVSTANDDLHDNFFFNEDIGRYSEIEEDETPLLKLVSDK